MKVEATPPALNLPPPRGLRWDPSSVLRLDLDCLIDRLRGAYTLGRVQELTAKF